jgi:hypothetical protein
MIGQHNAGRLTPIAIASGALPAIVRPLAEAKIIPNSIQDPSHDKRSL